MKSKSFLIVFAVLAMTFVPQSAYAGNDYLQQFENYSVMSMGGNVLRFTIPIWVYGEKSGHNTYYLNPHSANTDNKTDSYLWYSVIGEDPTPARGNVHRIVSFGGARQPNYDGRKSGGVGYAYALVGNGAGAIVVRNTYSGVPLTLMPNDRSHWIINDKDDMSENQRIEVTRMNTSYGKYTVYLQMDWYIPEALQGKTFKIGLNVCDYYVKDNDEHNNYFWTWAERYTSDNLQSPELFDPYFYAISVNGAIPKGKAGIAYVAYQDVAGYSTSINPGDTTRTEQQSGTIVVDMHDTVRTIGATVHVVPNKETGVIQSLRTNRVDVPAYHKIHNFNATEEKDDQESVTGDVTLRWNTVSPDAEDVMPSDIFEIQRATKSDFSDAKSIGIEALSSTNSEYNFTDESDDVRNVLKDDSTNVGTVATNRVVPIYYDGEPAGTITASMSSNVYSPGSTLYYRIRRGSAALWEWEESDWMKTTMLVKHDYLAPLKDEQPAYTLDPEFEDNRLVHFNFNLDNVAVTNNLDPVDQLSFSYTSVDNLSSKVPVEVEYKFYWLTTNRPPIENFSWVFFQDWGDEIDTLELRLDRTEDKAYIYKATVHDGVPVQFQFKNNGKLEDSWNFNPLSDVDIRFTWGATFWNLISHWGTEPRQREINISEQVAQFVNTDSVKQVLYSDLQAKTEDANYGRCSWDNNARLILTRTYVETGESMDFIIPKDSIRRQDDGSWKVHFTNDASRSCVHYQYSVRLDQSNSSLKVQNPTTQLLPKVLTGPELYRNEVAQIAEFTAEGNKKGVMLQWQPTAGSIDNYTLLRREKGSLADEDTLSIQTLEGFYDDTAEPGVTYEYKVEATYTCMGTTTSNSAIVEGTRLAFGSIAGRVQYEDYTGCYGTEVVLSSEGLPDITTITDETGAFFFDSLYYTAGDGRQTTYNVTPVSQNAQYHFNNTTSPTASVTLNKNNCEVENLYFDNISAVRFSGRVLYKNSSVPVRDANILLNGKLVKKSGDAFKTEPDGNFEINVPQNSAFTLQIVKEGHAFEGDGFVRIDGDSLLTLSKALDGVRVWDLTKVRLVGRVVGGQDQAALPLGHGLSKNNLGENIQLVLELEGDNISWLVFDPEDGTRDTLEFTVHHEVFDSLGQADSIGVTKVHYQKKRIIIDVDPTTGEYEADLFPTKYKIIQATARGYATLFAQGKTGETVDLSNAVTQMDTVTYENKYAISNGQFSITYRAPIAVTYQQYRYGMMYDYYGEKTYRTRNLAGEDVRIELTKQDSVTGEWNYLFGAPVFPAGLYQFRVNAHEDYYYNNDRANKPDVVNIKGGNLKVYNGMQETTGIKEYPLDQSGSALVEVLANHVTYVQDGDMALRQLDFSVESEGEYIEAEPLRAYILGAIEKQGDYLEMDTVSAGITLLDVLRDPPGSGSYATLEKGTTYHLKYKEYTNYRFGLELIFKYGNNNEYFIGTYAGSPAAGTTAGVINVVEKTHDWHLPLSVDYEAQHQSDYEITTKESISTSSDPYNVGSMADVYIGVTEGVMTGKSLAFRVVDSLSYEMLAGQRQNGTAMVVAQGTDENGRPWYLMRTEDILVKGALTSSFAYTQEHIFNTIIPNLLEYRDGLLLVGDSLDAVAAAEKDGKYIFWSRVAENDTAFGLEGTYEIVKASTYNGATVDKVDAANKSIVNWLRIIAQNEQTKVSSYYTTPFQTLSVSGGVTQSYSETYAYSNFMFDYWGYSHLPGLSDRVTGKQQSDGIGGFWFSLAFDKIWNKLIKGRDITEKMSNLIAAQKNGMSEVKDPADYVKVQAGTSEFDLDYQPIMDMGAGMIPENGMTVGESKTTSFTIAPHPNEHITFQIFKSKLDNFNDRAENDLENAADNNDVDSEALVFGSLMYRTLGGATMCPWEGGDSTLVYYQGTPMNKPTLKIENPQIVIDKHELSNIPHDGEGYFTLKMWNEIEESNGLAAGSAGIKFTLKLDEKTNPKGLEVIIDGQPLTDGREFRFTGSEVITKTVKVRAAKDYDYEDICLKLESQCTSTLTYQKACFSVHFIPVSCPVNISMPSDKWIMNTLSPKDEQGYYLPISIDGFDINYDNFDHIELQYKLVNQPNDAWINLCSYYAVDSLYQRASGTKKMIENGKIENYRFYGERDPMEQQYNLRAVSFCRHGSGFITRSSNVLTGTKDTRVPRVFGDPEPVDAILGVGDYFTLRFNEPIAGNYLDEDNNFQITGYTNESGITTETCIHFDGTANSFAESKVNRSIVNKSFTIDLLARPHDPANDEVFFTYPIGEDKLFAFGKTRDNRLYINATSLGIIESEPMPEPMTAFTRVIVAFDTEAKRFRFFAGTKEVTDAEAPQIPEGFSYSASAPIVFGKGFSGDMLEARLWTKALSTDEIANTHLRRLTGYEQELLAYYPMNEGRGDVLNDKAHGANLYTQGAIWDHKDGISLRVPADKRVKLDGNLMSRSATQDMTIMFWFKTNEATGTIFSAGRIDDKHGSELSLTDNAMVFHNDSNALSAAGNWADNEWHHLVLTVSRTFNSAAIFLDDKQYAEFPAVRLSAISGDMWFGGNGFDGFIDDYIIFEQALPKSLAESYGTISPYGDEMGLMAYLPFSEAKENSNGIIEQVFSVNDQRVFKTTDGQVVNKVVPLILEVSDKSDVADLAEKIDHAPVQSTGLLTKMNFDWSFNNDELLINLKMLDREINKQEIYVTVRDVEDLNGNPMASPVTWSAFVDRNSLKWDRQYLRHRATYGEVMDDWSTWSVMLINKSGKRHQYTIESLPDWIKLDETYGSLQPLEERLINIYFDPAYPVGEYSDVIYLTDENGLSEPLRVEMIVSAVDPYERPDFSQYPLNMSICGRVKIDDVYDSDPNDIVYAIYRNECIGKAHITYDNVANTSNIYLTVYGDETMTRKEVNFLLLQASTGKVLNLSPSEKITFEHGNVYGCGSGAPVIFTTFGSETQNIELAAGWNWVSFNLDLQPSNAQLNQVLTANRSWSEGDVIKNPVMQQFVTYSAENDAFLGHFSYLHYIYTYMVYSRNENIMRVSGNSLPEESAHLLLHGNGSWNALPCLLTKVTSLGEALSDYYDHATAGDLIKSHDQFAVFSTDRKWVGNLTALQPGEGYFIRRMGQGDVNVHFYNHPSGISPRRAQFSANQQTSHRYATNMTMIAMVEGEGLNAYIGDELVGKATKVGDLYFLTISCDRNSTVTFQTEDGTPLAAERPISYVADSHLGSILEPIKLETADVDKAVKRMINGILYIFRDGKVYNAQGSLVTNPEK